MRIISGKLGGRNFDSPKGNKTHPMSEKVRGGLFNALGDISGLTFLDGFAGSGALSFEAISRGAASVVAIDEDRHAADIIAQNSRILGVEQQIKITRANASSWSDNNQGKLFDAVLLDPPYDAIRAMLLVKLAEHTKLGGIVVLSLPPLADFVLPATNYTLLSSKNYGDAQLVFYRRTK